MTQFSLSLWSNHLHTHTTFFESETELFTSKCQVSLTRQQKNLKQRYIHLTTVAVDKQYVLHILIPCLLPELSSMQSACAILSSVPCLALPYLSTLCHKWHNFQKKKLLNVKCAFQFPLQPLSETFLIIRRIQDIIIHVQTSLFKVIILIFV